MYYVVSIKKEVSNFSLNFFKKQNISVFAKKIICKGFIVLRFLGIFLTFSKKGIAF